MFSVFIRMNASPNNTKKNMNIKINNGNICI